MKESLSGHGANPMIAIIGIDDADFLRPQFYKGDDVTAGAGIQLPEADHHAVILLQR